MASHQWFGSFDAFQEGRFKKPGQSLVSFELERLSS